MKRRVCCLLLGFCILCLPVQQVYAAPVGPAAKAEEKKQHEEEHKKPVLPKPGEKPVPPHEKKKGPLGKEKPEPPKQVEKPVPPHEKEKQKMEDKQPENIPVATPMATPKPTAIPTATPTPAPTVVQTSTQTTISAAGSGSEVVKYALKFVGNPYKYGGTSLTNGADCSGFVQSVYKYFNYSLPRTSREQASTGGYMNVSLNESALQPGDLIFYAKGNGVVYHVALYIGDGKVVHAANSRAGIIISEYTYMKPYKARRVIR